MELWINEPRNAYDVHFRFFSDLYQITMAYAYWKSGKTNDYAVFDLFFRNNPFHGEFTIFAGLEECLKFVKNFHYSAGDINYLKTVMPEGIEEEVGSFNFPFL